MSFFLCVIGMVLIVEGLPWFGWPDKMKLLSKTISGTEDFVMRRIGFFMMLAGLVLVWLGKN